MQPCEVLIQSHVGLILKSPTLSLPQKAQEERVPWHFHGSDRPMFLERSGNMGSDRRRLLGIGSSDRKVLELWNTAA